VTSYRGLALLRYEEREPGIAAAPLRTGSPTGFTGAQREWHAGQARSATAVPSDQRVQYVHRVQSSVSLAVIPALHIGADPGDILSTSGRYDHQPYQTDHDITHDYSHIVGRTCHSQKPPGELALPAITFGNRDDHLETASRVVLSPRIVPRQSATYRTQD
jgi:hypothetical protein